MKTSVEKQSFCEAVRSGALCRSLARGSFVVLADRCKEAPTLPKRASRSRKPRQIGRNFWRNLYGLRAVLAQWAPDYPEAAQPLRTVATDAPNVRVREDAAKSQ